MTNTTDVPTSKFRVQSLPLKAPVTCAAILDYGRALQAATAPIEVKKYRLGSKSSRRAYFLNFSFASVASLHSGFAFLLRFF